MACSTSEARMTTRSEPETSGGVYFQSARKLKRSWRNSPEAVIRRPARLTKVATTDSCCS